MSNEPLIDSSWADDCEGCGDADATLEPIEVGTRGVFMLCERCIRETEND